MKSKARALAYLGTLHKEARRLTPPRPAPDLIRRRESPLSVWKLPISQTKTCPLLLLKAIRTDILPTRLQYGTIAISPEEA